MLAIKVKAREFKKKLLNEGFDEAKFYKENKVCKYRFYKKTIIDVAFIVNLEVFNDKIEIHYGYASTAFTKMTGCEDTLKKSVLSVLSDSDMKKNIATVQELIKKAPGNKGGAETIINYYESGIL